MSPNSTPAASALRRVVETSGDLHQVQDLEKNGIRKVRVLSQSHLQDSIRVAIHRSLDQCIDTIDVSDAVRSQLRTVAESEFAKLVAEGLERPTAPAPTTSEDNGSIPVEVREEARQIAAIAGIQQEGGDLNTDMSTLESRLARNLGSLLADDVRREMEKVEDSQRRQVDLLERRITKLAQALESTDRILAHLKAAPDEAGSVTRFGAAPQQSPLSEKKSELLEALFEANLELQQLTGEE